MDDLADWRDEWHDTLLDVAEETRTVYLRSVNQFLAWLTDEAPEVQAAKQITRQHVHRWLGSLAEAGRSESTRRVRLIALRLWLGYIAADPNSGLPANPAEGVDLPTVKVQPTPVIHDADLAALLRSADGASFIDRRDTAILRVLLDTGCRRAELAGIDLGDLDLRAHEITLRRTKGGRGRIVPVGPKTAIALRKYLRARARHPLAESSALFLSAKARSGDGRITGGAVAEMLSRRCEAIGLPAINPHRFRHTWASDLLAHGANEGDVEKLAGWRSPLMVRRYSASTAEARARDAARRLARGDRV
ncbi:hypothetical protein GCM10023215_02380 [Pseudonocardia yuanmonensis]|uniref:Site-specific recombinase XerD n=1 Tax=Pseudonocardia yuanmonensis TaxID=1095914 RepID=A0ABP8VZ85_9PSEU